MKIITIIGTRPQFIKMSLLSNLFIKNNINEIIIHTGQHFDVNMSQTFFSELNIPIPHYSLNINQCNPAKAMTIMIAEIEKILLEELPDYVIVYGDCNTTLAGALVAKMLDLKVIHVESGLRSYDKSMPEEINRILTDQISTILFCPTENAVENLNKEGIHDGIYFVGDLMIELLEKNMEKIKREKIVEKLGIEENNYYVLTIHRKSNTNLEQLQKIIGELAKVDKKIIFPIHPRTKKVLENFVFPANFLIIEPLGYLEMMSLVISCRLAITDSGGLQKETYYLKKPCIILRENTEWIETLDVNILTNCENLCENIEKIEKDIENNNLEWGYSFLDNCSENILKIIRSL